MAQLEEMEAIRALHSRYVVTVDGRDHKGWADCFTADGVFASPRLGTHEGAEGLETFCRDYHAALDGIQPRHVISTVTADITGDTATGWCYLTYYHSKDGVTELSAVGGYHDRLRKVDGRWLFERRDVFLD